MPTSGLYLVSVKKERMLESGASLFQKKEGVSFVEHCWVEMESKENV